MSTRLASAFTEGRPKLVCLITAAGDRVATIPDALTDALISRA